MCLSDPQTAVAMTLRRTSAGAGTGTGTVLISVAEGPGAGLVLTTAVMVEGSFGPPFVERPFLGLDFGLPEPFAINSSSSGSRVPPHPDPLPPAGGEGKREKREIQWK